ncbi:MAG TPA: maleylpyruvate isomerase N-terminal domain-containing protein, partial [Candidatus Eisenbacteria bacterium]|nr:maleylpyruvate isomerase N-terminal domain-containing protein [Candidatus Eisenbacteria bacterium]
MGDVDGLRDRVQAARRGYAALPHAGWGAPGPADEQTGERWDRGHVLGHVAEMLPYWTGQVRAVLAGAEAMGRDEVGFAQRRVGIDGGREAGEDGLLARIDAGIEGLLALLAELA